MSDKVLVEQRGHVLIVTLNRPEVRNCVDMDVCNGVADAVERAETDPEIRALVITGAGDQAFCAGADLKAIARGELLLPPGRERLGFAGFVNNFTSKPTIAAVNGNALGGGTELLLACDLAVAVETANVGLPEVKRGLIAGAGGAFRIAKQLPQKLALELLLTGRPLPAPEALGWGLLNRVVAPGQALDAALELANEIAANAPLAVQSSKRVAYGATPEGRPDERDYWKLNDREILAILKTEDAFEGPTAFAEKRAPVWKAR
jgi:crotonobetainyl-CoA hydratase